MSRVEDAIALVTSYADDDSHGYELRCRDYGIGSDCAGLVRMYAAACEGVAVSDYPDFGTWSEVSTLTARGWTATEFSKADMRRGDVLLRALGDSTGHTVVYLGDGRIVGAEGNWDGVRGDSSGNEVTVRGYYDYRYNWILRPPASCYGDARDEWVQAGDGRWYLFDDDGWMLTGWQQVGGRWYYLSETHGDPPYGSMRTGWVQVGGKWYFLTDDGWMLTGWQQVGGRWYYLSETHGDPPYGSMRTGWVQVGGKWYFLTDDGSMATGWVRDGGSWYWTDEDGSMHVGWKQVGGKWYWLNPDGSMSADEVELIDGTFYGFDASGVMLSHSLTVAKS